MDTKKTTNENSGNRSKNRRNRNKRRRNRDLPIIYKAKRGDIFASNGTIFIFKSLETEPDSGRRTVNCICAITIPPLADINASTKLDSSFVIPKNNNLVVGYADQNIYRYATPAQKLFLTDTIARHGYTIDIDSQELVKIPEKNADFENDYSLGDIVIDTISRGVFVVSSPDFMRRCTATNARTGEHVFIPASGRHIRKWNISDAENGDVIATDNFIFIYKNTVTDYKTGKINVMYHCAIDNNLQSDDYQFHIPAENATMGNTLDTKYRFATFDEKRVLYRQMERHGYYWDDKCNKMKMIPNRMYETGCWLIKRNNKKLYFVKDFDKNEYILSDQSGNTIKYHSAQVNNECRFTRWTTNNAVYGEILHYEDNDFNERFTEWLVIVEKPQKQNHDIKILCRYNMNTGEIDHPTRVIADSLKPAMNDDKKMLLDALIDADPETYKKTRKADSNNKNKQKKQKPINNKNKNAVYMSDSPKSFKPGDIVFDEKSEIPFKLLPKQTNISYKGTNLRNYCDEWISSEPSSIRKWKISDAKNGDILATNEFIFIFKEAVPVGETGNFSVKYHCATLIDELNKEEYPFHISGPNCSVIGTGNSENYRYATYDEKNKLADEMSRNGYVWDFISNGLMRVAAYKYDCGEWIVCKETNEPLKICGYIDGMYIIENLSKNMSKVDAEDINNIYKYRKWSVDEAEKGDILCLIDYDGTKWLVMVDSINGEYITALYKYCVNNGNMIHSCHVIKKAFHPASNIDRETMLNVIANKYEKCKFHEGDWIVSMYNNSIKTQVIGIEYDKYCFNGYKVEKIAIDKNYRKWTIADAVSGEYLVSTKTVRGTVGIAPEEPPLAITRKLIFIYDNKENGRICAKFSLDTGTNTLINRLPDNWWNLENIRPATKSEKDLLYQKIIKADKCSTAESVHNRLDCNKHILLLLEDFFEKNPDIRFGQFISNLNTNSGIDLFVEEPCKTLERVRNYIEKTNNNKL